METHHCTQESIHDDCLLSTIIHFVVRAAYQLPQAVEGRTDPWREKNLTESSQPLAVKLCWLSVMLLRFFFFFLIHSEFYKLLENRVVIFKNMFIQLLSLLSSKQNSTEILMIKNSLKYHSIQGKGYAN